MGHDLSPLSSHDISRRVSQLSGGDRRIWIWHNAETIWSALRAVVALECPRPPLRNFTIEMGRGLLADNNQSKEPSGADEGAGGFRSADFSGASPVASALGIRSGATPGGRSVPRSVAASLTVYKNASAVASSNTASSTRCALRAAASRSAVIASLFTLRGIPLVA